MPASVRVLVVEDDDRLASTLADGLEEDGFSVDLAGTVSEGRHLALTGRPDLIVVDVALPDGSGVDLTRNLRSLGVTAPILVLTARGDTRTTVTALDRGADAYVVKPVAIEALGARLRALYRRSTAGSGDAIAVGDLELEPERLTARRGETAIDLTPIQARILEALMTNAGRVLTRSRLIDLAWQGAVLPASNVVDVHVRTLRSKIDVPFGTSTIETIRGMGYRIPRAD